MKSFLTGLVLTGALLCGLSPRAAAQTPAAPAQEMDSLSLAMGIYMGDIIRSSLQDYERMGLEVDPATVLSALRSAVLSPGRMFMTPAQARDFIDSRLRRSTGAVATPVSAMPEAVPERQQALVKDAAARPGAIVLPETGTVLEVLEAGSGKVAELEDIVEIRYTGTLADGYVFDSIGTTETPEVFPVAALTPGLIEAFTSPSMPAGGRYRLTLPPAAGYGAEGVPGAIPPGAALVFEIEYISAE